MARSTSSRRSSSRTQHQAFLKKRIARLRASMTESKFASFLITRPCDIRYLTGFSGEDSTALVTANQVYVVSDFRFQEELQHLKGIARVVIRKSDMMEALRELIGDIKPFSVAIQAEYCSVAWRKKLAKAIGARRLRDSVGVLNSLRIIKDEWEIRQIRKAVRIQEQAFEYLLDEIEPGRTEQELAAWLGYEMQAAGAQKPSFDIIMAARANGSLPHATPGKTKTARNQPLLIDWGAQLDGYCSDMTRTLTLGRWPRQIREIYEIILEANQTAIDAVRPGILCSDLDEVARDVIRRAGYGGEFGHSLGHGIGLDIHEAPRLAASSNETLKPGMVVTIEPGIYLPGVGGVRIEDDVLVTDRGCRNLCTLPKDIDWATR